MTGPELSEVHQEIMSLQTIVEEQLRNATPSYWQLDVEGQIAFRERATNHVRFAYSGLDNVWEGLSVCATGEGVFLVSEGPLDDDSEFAFNLYTVGKANWLLGLLGEAAVKVVSPLQDVMNGTITPMREAPLSVLIEVMLPELDIEDERLVIADGQRVFLALAYPGLIFDENDEMTHITA